MDAQALFVTVISVLLLLLISTAKEILRTLKRIDARMALTAPTEDEKRAIQDDSLSGSLIPALIGRIAMHPEIWIHQCVRDRQGLKGTEYKEQVRWQRFIEKKLRN